jgi:hypothetical protein
MPSHPDTSLLLLPGAYHRVSGQHRIVAQPRDCQRSAQEYPLPCILSLTRCETSARNTPGCSRARKRVLSQQQREKNALTGFFRLIFFFLIVLRSDDFIPFAVSAISSEHFVPPGCRTVHCHYLHLARILKRMHMRQPDPDSGVVYSFRSGCYRPGPRVGRGTVSRPLGWPVTIFRPTEYSELYSSLLEI